MSLSLLFLSIYPSLSLSNVPSGASTTHIFASNLSGSKSQKVFEAKKKNHAKLVTPEWAIECAKKGGKVCESRFMVRIGDEVRFSTLLSLFLSGLIVLLADPRIDLRPLHPPSSSTLSPFLSYALTRLDTLFLLVLLISLSTTRLDLDLLRFLLRLLPSALSSPSSTTPNTSLENSRLRHLPPPCAIGRCESRQPSFVEEGEEEKDDRDGAGVASEEEEGGGGGCFGQLGR
jgi:hypothetical protein